jgi:hypothetical protein
LRLSKAAAEIWWRDIILFVPQLCIYREWVWKYPLLDDN